ncbi:MAG TPA: SRPBCC family protein [Verrucomicrobiae bacterium]|nr:SRPBCC family protein [Verrucomicrobiae bacterium]
MTTKNISHRVTLPAKPAGVFAALMDSKRHSRFTGEPARIDARPGGAFTCYGDYITGITLELEPGKRIVQAWRSQNWPAGTNSIVTFALAAKSGGRTELRFSQVGVPANDYAKKNEGWRTHYWEPLKRFLEAREQSKS